MNNRAGKYKNNLLGVATYKSFVPTPLPPDPPIELTNEIINTLTKASVMLALLDNMVEYIPNLNLFLSMYIRKEALLSSQIEGTQATLEDILDPMIESNTNRDVADVINYIKAIEFAVKRLDTLPLCNRLIKETHSILLDSARGQDKSPGEFRNSQNWIGGVGSTLKNATYIPPSPEDMVQAMSDLEKYINSDDDLNPLIQAAIIHYQFETIHPFLDGNGRIGRLLVTLFLIQKNILSSPVLYISYYLKKNRIEYYDRMTEVREKGNYEQWILFFLRAIIESSTQATETIEKLLILHAKNIELISNSIKLCKNTMKLFNYLEANPIIDIKKTAEELKLSFNTISDSIKKLIELEILVQKNNANRNRIFVYQEYVDLLKEGT